MNVEMRVNLTDGERMAAQELIKEVQLVDGTARDPYLYNTFNFDTGMPSFFLAYEQKELIGLLTVYADSSDEEAEFYIYVHPLHRRNGIARQLIARAKKELTRYKLPAYTYVTEHAFLEKHPDFLQNTGLTVNDETETWLVRNRTVYNLPEQTIAQVQEAKIRDVEAIARFQAEAFGEDLITSETYARESILNEQCLLYLLKIDNKVIASITVDRSSEYNYLFGLAVASQWRGQGLGSYLVQSTVNKMISQNEKDFQIAVEDTNVGAKRLYERLGFILQTQVIYLDEETA